MVKGTISLEDAELIYDFANRVQKTLSWLNRRELVESAETVSRISYCAMAEARANARAEHYRQQHFLDDPYITEVAE